jgi:hypothetical protein
MTRIRQSKTNFTGGEISRRLLGRADLRAFDNGALSLRNVFIQPTGGVTRRAGLTYAATTRGAGRLAAFEFNTEQTFLLVFTAGKIDILQNGAPVASVDAPWTAEQLKQLNWTQTADTLLALHPDVAPRKLTRSEAGVWTLSVWSLAEKDGVSGASFYRFTDAAVTLTPSAVSGAITVTASAPVFDPAQDGTRLQIGRKQLLITGVSSPTQVNATVKQTLAGTAATTDWEEEAFSPRRGWPVSAAFHQNRLVLGGSRSLPNRIWMSKTGDLWNFDVGEGLDDEAVEFAILSDQVNAVRALFAGRHLQVFTSGAEYMVTGEPLTPTNIQVKHQTRVGSPLDRTVPPRDVDGATLFVARSGREIREFLYTDTEAAYQANDLALLAVHLVKNPADQDYDKLRRLLFVVMADGGLATLTIYRNEQVNAWAGISTDGAFRSVAAVGDEVYVLVERTGGVWTVERFADDVPFDAAVSAASTSPKTAWGGFDHLEGRTVQTLADGVTRGTATVQAGAVNLVEAASTLVAGLPFAHVVEPLPPNLLNLGGEGRCLRPAEAVFRLEETQALRVDVGAGLFDFPLHAFGPQPAEGQPPVAVTGDRRVRALGWRRDIDRPLWRIEQDAPAPFTLLSVIMDLKVND